MTNFSILRVPALMHLIRILSITVTVLFTPDEEISSPGGRHLIKKLAHKHDYVFSCEPNTEDALSLATGAVGAAYITVHGKSAHAGRRPEEGRNALVELSHQILQTSNLSNLSLGMKFNWTVAKAGSSQNVIPDEAKAQADVRAKRVQDFDEMQSKFEAAVKKQLVEGTRIETRFERRREPLEVSQRARNLAKVAQEIYKQMGMSLKINDVTQGGGTDAGFAMSDTNVVIEGLGIPGGNYHNRDEFVFLDLIEPRLFLLTGLIVEVNRE